MNMVEVRGLLSVTDGPRVVCSESEAELTAYTCQVLIEWFEALGIRDFVDVEVYPDELWAKLELEKPMWGFVPADGKVIAFFSFGVEWPEPQI